MTSEQKLQVKDIRILGEGQQLKRAMIADSGSLEAFIEKYDLPYTIESVKSYVKRVVPHSDKIGNHVMAALRKPYNQIVRSPLRQLEDYADGINDNIEKYYKRVDLRVVRKVLGMVEEQGGNINTIRAKLYRAMGMMHFYVNEIGAAEEHIEKAMKIAKERLVYDLYVTCNLDMAMIKWYLLKYSDAERFCLAVQKYKEYIEVREKTRYYYYSAYGNIMFTMEEYQKAIDNYEEATKHAQTQTDKADLYVNIGTMCHKKSDNEKAMEMYTKAEHIYKEDEIVGRSTIYNNKAEILKEKELLEEAEINIKKAISLVEGKVKAYEMAYTFNLIEVRIKKGEIEAIDEIFSMIKSTKRVFSYRAYVISGINAVIKAFAKNEKVLRRLEQRMFDYVKSLRETKENKEYVKEIGASYADVLRRISRMGSRGRGCKNENS